MPGSPYLSSTYYKQENALNMSLLILALVFGIHHGPAWAIFFLILATAVRFLPVVVLLDLIAPVIITVLQKHRRTHHGH